MNRYYNRETTDGENGRRLALTLPSGRKPMEYQTEMIANNDVAGLLPFSYLTSDGKPRFYYDLSGTVTLDEYFNSSGRGVRRLAEILADMASAVCGLEKFLLDEKCLVFDTDMIFVDPEKKRVKLVYLPVVLPEDAQTRFSDFASELVKKINPEDATGKLFCARIIEEVNGVGFRYEAFIDFLFDIICFSENGRGDGTDAPAPVQEHKACVTESPTNYGRAKSVTAPAAGIMKAFERVIKHAPTQNDESILLPALVSCAIAAAYFGAISLIPAGLPGAATYRLAALLLSVGAELLLLRHFIANRKKSADGVARPARVKDDGFGKTVRAASEISALGAHASETDKDPAFEDLWSGSVGKEDVPVACELTAPETDSPYEDKTELLAGYKKVDAKLLIKDAMREFGVSLIKDEFTIGRKKDCSDLVLENPAVGKEHARLFIQDGHWYVKDLFSKNGTYLNNIKLSSGGQCELNKSDQITVANVDMIFTPV